jgi:hypothetical protein
MANVNPVPVPVPPQVHNPKHANDAKEEAKLYRQRAFSECKPLARFVAEAARPSATRVGHAMALA